MFFVYAWTGNGGVKITSLTLLTTDFVPRVEIRGLKWCCLGKILTKH